MMSQDTQTISDYINTVTDFSPDRLHASLSYHMYPNARNAIKQFFADPSIRNIAYGWSSGHMRVHMLYRHDAVEDVVVSVCIGLHRSSNLRHVAAEEVAAQLSVNRGVRWAEGRTDMDGRERQRLRWTATRPSQSGQIAHPAGRDASSRS